MTGAASRADGSDLSAFRHACRMPRRDNVSEVPLEQQTRFAPWNSRRFRTEDSVVSLREEWERQWLSNFEQVSADGHSQQFLGFVPWAFVHAFLQASEQEQHDLIIDLAVPWYCRFRSGWRQVEESGTLSVASVRYDTLARDELNAIQNLLRQLGETVPDEIVGKHIAAVKADRFAANINVGQSGRAQSLLTDAQRAR